MRNGLEKQLPPEAVPHSLIPSFPHSLIPSFPHSLIPSFPHSLIPSFPHSLIPSFPHSLIPSFPHSLIPSFPHSLIPSFPHSLIPQKSQLLVRNAPNTPVRSVGCVIPSSSGARKRNRGSRPRSIRYVVPKRCAIRNPGMPVVSRSWPAMYRSVVM